MKKPRKHLIAFVPDGEVLRGVYAGPPEETFEKAARHTLSVNVEYTGRRYIHRVAIRLFEDKATEKFFFEGRVAAGAGWGSVRSMVRRKLDMLHYAAVLSDLKSPPGNRLEALRGNLAGFYSVRINDRWRVVFEWTAEGPARVRVTDYH